MDNHIFYVTATLPARLTGTITPPAGATMTFAPPPPLSIAVRWLPKAFSRPLPSIVSLVGDPATNRMLILDGLHQRLAPQRLECALGQRQPFRAQAGQRLGQRGGHGGALVGRQLHQALPVRQQPEAGIPRGAERELWGKARRPLENAAAALALAPALRRRAWRLLAQAARGAGDEARAVECEQAAAAVD